MNKNKKVTKADVTRMKEMYANGVSEFSIAEAFNVSIREAIELLHNFTERDFFKLYYDGLTPKFIALKLGVTEETVTYWIYLKNVEDNKGTVKDSDYRDRNYTYKWRKQHDNIIAKGKKCCKTKEEQEAKCIRLLGNEVEAYLNKEEVLNPEVLTRVSEKLGYKDTKYFKKAIQSYGLMTDELEGIFAKM